MLSYLIKKDEKRVISSRTYGEKQTKLTVTNIHINEIITEKIYKVFTHLPRISSYKFCAKWFFLIDESRTTI